MAWSKIQLLAVLLLVGHIQKVTSQCPSAFPNGDVSNLCYYYKRTALSWTDAYDQCLSKTDDGVLIQIFTSKQFDALKNADITGKGYVWLGANNFASFLDSQWHWLDGSVVSDSAIPWCSNSTHDLAIGAQCAAYDAVAQCLTNFPCSTLLPAPCVTAIQAVKTEPKIALSARLIYTGKCTNAYGGAYANWWTYTLLLLNWFILFCFILYLSVRFNINKRTVILTMIVGVLSFMMIIAFAILWGVQYQDILQFPLIVVILGCAASILFLVHILILVCNRRMIQRSTTCAIVTVIVIVVECGLMIGVILCIANCSDYISLPSTLVDKDIIASLLAGNMAAVSIAFYTGLLYLIGEPSADRVLSFRTTGNNAAVANASQAVVPRRSQHQNEVNPRGTARKHDRLDRGTSPVDERILEEFYTDRPKDMHQYHLDGRQYVVYEGKTFSDVDPLRKELTQAMLLQEPQGLRDAIARARSSPHASTLAAEIRQAESSLSRLQ